MTRAILIVLDSVGCGGAEDARLTAMRARTRSATSRKPARSAAAIATACAGAR